MAIIKRYRFFIVTLLALIAMFLIKTDMGLKALDVTKYSVVEMATVIPPIFILLGLLDVWVPKETMMKHMGQRAGIRGLILAFIIGSLAAGPLYGAFPIAGVFMKKGVKLRNVLIFIGAWSTTKLPMFLFEISALGGRFAVTRLLVNIPAIIIIAWLLEKTMSSQEVKELYIKAENECMQ